MDGCRFCQVVAGGRDAHVLFEDERTLAFLDDNPATPGHALVVPKRHAEDLLLLGDAEGAAVMLTAQRLARAMETALGPDGYSVFHTTGGLVGTVEHAHLHLVPRWEDDEVHLALERNDLPESAAESQVEAIRAALKPEG